MKTKTTSKANKAAGNTNKPTKSAKPFIILSIVVVLIGAISYASVVYSPRRINVRAATSLASCYNVANNLKIWCVASSAEVSGFRYAACCGDLKVPGWQDYWIHHGYPNLMIVNGGFGNDPRSWWANRSNDSRNFLDCSGFVNVVFYLATGLDPLVKPVADPYSVRETASTYQNSPNFTRIIDMHSLQLGDVLVRGYPHNDHAGIFGGYIPASGKEPYKTLITYEGVNDGTFRTGSRQRADGWYDYALRYNKPIKGSGNQIPI